MCLKHLFFALHAARDSDLKETIMILQYLIEGEAFLEIFKISIYVFGCFFF